MKCPSCHKEECKYIEQRKKSGSSNKIENRNKPERTNFKAKCKKCGWEGTI